MSKYGIQITTPAASYPVSVATATEYLRALESESTHISDLIANAAQEVERYTGRPLLSASYRLTLSDWPRASAVFAGGARNPVGAYERNIVLPRAPVISVSSVEYYAYDGDGATLSTLSASSYLLISSFEPAFVHLRESYNWPALESRPDAIRVNFTAGYASASAVPRRLVDAMLLLCRASYAGGSPNLNESPELCTKRANAILDQYKFNGLFY